MLTFRLFDVDGVLCAFRKRCKLRRKEQVNIEIKT
jgi:hypothetical protein